MTGGSVSDGFRHLVRPVAVFWLTFFSFRHRIEALKKKEKPSFCL